SNDQIRAIVKTGQLSDAAAENYLVDCLIRRRDKIGKAFFGKVLPLDRFMVKDGELTFEDLAKTYGVGVTTPLRVSWSRFDNDTEKKTAMSGTMGFAVPKEALNATQTAYFAADISREGETKRTITVYLRTGAQQQPQVVGIDRSW